MLVNYLSGDRVKMKKAQYSDIIILIIFIFGLIFMAGYIFSNEPITDKYEKACNSYGMEYVYTHSSTYCIDKQNKLYEFYSDCTPEKGKECQLRFITI